MQGGARTGAQRTFVREHRKRSDNAAHPDLDVAQRCPAALAISSGGLVAGTLLSRLNLLKDVAARRIGKTRRRFVGTVVHGQGKCPVLDLDDGEDHVADVIRWWRSISDGGV